MTFLMFGNMFVEENIDMDFFIDSFFLGQDGVEGANSQQYDGLNMDVREETTIDHSIYRDLRRITRETAGKIFNDVMAFPLKTIGCRHPLIQPEIYTSKPISITILNFQS